jgi:hypothetical protein
LRKLTVSTTWKRGMGFAAHGNRDCFAGIAPNDIDPSLRGSALCDRSNPETASHKPLAVTTSDVVHE